jgi:hypothetical protein
LDMEQLRLVDYEAAYRYLASAVAPAMKVERVSTDPDLAPTVRLSVQRGPSTRVHMVRWMDAETLARTRKPRPDVLWVLHDTPAELRHALRARGYNYIDPRGAVRIALPGILIDRDNLPPVDFAPPSETATDPFADRSSLVVRTLLSHSVQRAWGIRELAESAGVGLGTASRVVEQLHRLDLVDAPPEQGKLAKVRVADPQRILDRWTRSYDWTRNESVTLRAPVGDPERFVADHLHQYLSTYLVRDRSWALTLQAGAAFVTRHASWQRVHVYIEANDSRELRNFAAATGLSPSEDGALVLMRPFYRTSLWLSLQHAGRRKPSALPIVSSLQLVLDLWNYPLRGREQAEVIRDRILEPVWFS